MKRIIYIFLLTNFLVQQSYAKHIVGGEITYECLGNNNYEFTLKVYRDCQSMGADFDSPAIVTIYTGGSIFEEVDNVNFNFPANNIPIDQYPCLEPPDDLCVEEAIYVWQSNLPSSSQSYHISYQRCCRNNTIGNIINPEDSGATYTIELTSAAQSSCNNSPFFNDFPPVVICANTPINFDHSATDPDGDQLIYEFCSPLLGGGMLGTPENPGDPSSCDGVAPDPACPPPYDEVDFVLPTYSATNPMAGNPQVTIDPNTGFISGSPTLEGQYVVGVCVSEYRDGQLLSTVRRDFQFNVRDCAPLVIADVQEDVIINDQEFLINVCGDTTIQLVNQSIQEQNINEFRWEFSIDGATETYNDWNPVLDLPGLGIYDGFLFLNPGTLCADTARIYINVFPAINADFTFSYDTCVAGPVSFTDLSTSDGDEIIIWEWDLIDSLNNNQNPSHQFSFPGMIPVQLFVEDNNGCTDSITQVINWFPAPEILLIEPDTFQGCEPLELNFNNLSTPIDSTYDISWDFGDGGTSSSISPVHTYEEEGIYTISLSVTSPIGCGIDTIYPNWITVRPSPEAFFTYDPSNPSNIQPTVNFTDGSFEADNWYWDFGGEYNTDEQNPSYTFQDTGLYRVLLYVTHPSGCIDSFIQIIDVKPEIRYYLPNAFTPNYDDKNDFFKGKGFFNGITNFSMSIWNRWGERIFETSNPDEPWNGKKNNTGKESPEGVYVVVVTYTGPRGEPYELKGFATLLR